MRHSMTPGPPADGGYPLDSDLHQMTDDGCPLVLDPARWADEDWRDNLGVWDTVGGEVGADQAGPNFVRSRSRPEPPRVGPLRIC